MVLVLVIFTGLFKEFLLVFSIIIIHEFGHLFSAVYYKWNIDRISIYPYGGCVSFNEKLNRPIKEEFIILIMGPLVQVFYLFIFYLFFRFGFVSYKMFVLFKSYNVTLLCFNLLPIYPLDGGRIVNLLFNFFLPYRRCNFLIIVVSILFIFIVVVNCSSINLVMMMVFLLSEVFVFVKQQDYLYNKFLLERFLFNFSFYRVRVIKNKNNFYRGKRHVLYKDFKYVTEREYLKERYR